MPKIATTAEVALKIVEAMKLSRGHTLVTIKKLDEDRQICWAEVWAPNIIDTYGETMLQEDIELMAHRFMQLDMKGVIDTNHNNIPNGSYPVESFIAREGDPDYTPGAWVLGTKVVDPVIWAAIKKGDLNGYSFEALVRKLPAIAVLELTRDNLGLTEENDGHRHIFFAELDEDGKIVKGRTTTDQGHSHEIRKGTATEQSGGHSHRIFV